MRRRHRRGGTRGGPVRRPCQALARLLALSLGIAAATGWNSAAAATLTEHMDIACTQQDVTALHCDYRLLEGGTLKSAAAEHNGSVVEGDHASSYPGPGDTTAVLALVDTSDPRLKRNKRRCNCTSLSFYWLCRWQVTMQSTSFEKPKVSKRPCWPVRHLPLRHVDVAG